MATQTYIRSIERFERYLKTAVEGRYTTPHAMIRASEAPMTSGFRDLKILESEGLLARDEFGAFLAGPEILRMRLSATGIGNLASALKPVLVRLRQEALHTAFFACIEDRRLSIVSYSVGRATKSLRLRSDYELEKTFTPSRGGVHVISFVNRLDGVQSRQTALVTDVANGYGVIGVVGLLLRSTGVDHERLTAMLNAARARLC